MAGRPGLTPRSRLLSETLLPALQGMDSYDMPPWGDREDGTT